ncbi:MAG: DUF2452 domain-containing protein [bacterium]|nr:DUF2452 domain-containing protein [bacterium]
MSEKRGKKVDLSRVDMDRMKEMTVADPGLIEFAHTVGSALVKPIDQGKTKGKAIAAMHDQTHRQFKQLYDQMQTLVNQARDLQQRVDISERIYLAQMSFEPVINYDYYLYERKDGTDLLSMVSPQEWGKKFPFNLYIAHVKLLSDHTWEVIESPGQDL